MELSKKEREAIERIAAKAHVKPEDVIRRFKLIFRGKKVVYHNTILS